MPVRGSCTVLFVHDVGAGIDLDAAEERVGELRRRIRLRHMKRAAPSASEMEAPLHVSGTETPVPVGIFETSLQVDATIYEFGAICTRFRIPFDVPPERLAELSDALYDHEGLLAVARERAARLLDALGPAVERPRLSELTEDYAIFHIRDAGGVAPDAWLHDHGGVSARILRGERGPLSRQEREDALSRPLAYAPEELVLVDWYAALLVGEEMADEEAVLELALVELLELRHLDEVLDEALQAAWDLLARPRKGLPGLLASRARDLQRVAELRAESAMLYEGVSNAYKMLGDQYLARLYHAAADRFRLTGWDGAIERKLQTLSHIYEILADAAANRRIEALEWVIILLIAVEILAGLLGLW